METPTQVFSDTDGTDENGNVSTRKLYIDQRTRLPLKDVSLVGDVVVSEIFYDYAPRLLRRAELAGDFFSVGRPATVASEDYHDFADDPPPSPLPEPPVQTAQQLEDAWFAYAMRFRESFGLNTDPGFVRGTVTDPALVPSIVRFSVPLTAAEEQEMRLRDAIQQATAEKIRSYGAKHSDTFAGAYIDQRNGGLVYVGFTEDAEAHMDALKERFPYPDMLRSFPASLSLRALVGLYHRVEGDWGALQQSGIPINYAAVDERSNTLVVGVEKPTAEIERELTERYGDAVRVEAHRPAVAAQGQRRPRARRRAIVGGRRIERIDGLGGLCTGGFTLRRTTGTGADRRTQYGLLTAGHCRAPGATKLTPWYYRDELDPFGRMATNPACCAIDAARIGVSPRRASNRVLVSLREGEKSTGIRSWQRATEGSYQQTPDGTPTGSPGDRICFTGATTWEGSTFDRNGDPTPVDEKRECTPAPPRPRMRAALEAARHSGSHL